MFHSSPTQFNNLPLDKFTSTIQELSASPNMEKPDDELALPNQDVRQTSRQFKGIRLREWGKWVSEIRMPKSREKIYLGSYHTAEQAARAFDAAMYCLRGPKAKFNFPDSVPAIPSSSSLSPQQIRVAAAKYALNELSSSLPLPHPNIDNNSKDEPSLPNQIDNNGKEGPSQLSSASEMKLSSDEQQKSEELAFWQSLFARSDPDGYLNLEKIPSIDEALALEFIPTSQDDDVDVSVDATELWNFDDK